MISMVCSPEKTKHLRKDDFACEGDIGAIRCATKSRWRLLAAPVTLACMDLALTLLGQTDQYWSGDHSAVLESNPLARVLLETHPFALVAAYLPYLAAMAALVLRSRPAMGRVWALVFTLAHAFGASTWTLRLPGGIVLCVAIWVAARWLYGLKDETQ